MYGIAPLQLSTASMLVPAWVAWHQKRPGIFVILMCNWSWSTGVHAAASPVHKWYHTMDYLFIGAWVGAMALAVRSSATPSLHVAVGLGVAALNWARQRYPHASPRRVVLHALMHVSGSFASAHLLLGTS